MRSISPRAFEQGYLHPGRPLVITEGARSWKAISSWTPGYLREALGATPVAVYRYPRGDYFQEEFFPMAFDDYMDVLESGPDDDATYYLSALLQKFPVLLPDVSVPSLVPPEHLLRTVLWVGRDSVTPAHYHPQSEALLCQVTGRKRVLLFGPEQSDLLYPMPARSHRFHFSRVEQLDAPDLQRFPAFRGARPAECVLEPGEALFIPIHWWHAVYGQDFSVSVTYFFRSRWWSVLRAPRAPWRHLVTLLRHRKTELLRLMGLLPNPDLLPPE